MPDFTPRHKPQPIRAVRLETDFRARKGDWVGITADGAVCVYPHEQFVALFNVEPVPAVSLHRKEPKKRGPDKKKREWQTPEHERRRYTLENGEVLSRNSIRLLEWLTANLGQHTSTAMAEAFDADTAARKRLSARLAAMTNRGYLRQDKRTTPFKWEISAKGLNFLRQLQPNTEG